VLEQQPPGTEAAARAAASPESVMTRTPKERRDRSCELRSAFARPIDVCDDVGKRQADGQKASDHDDDRFRTSHHDQASSRGHA